MWSKGNSERVELQLLEVAGENVSFVFFIFFLVFLLFCVFSSSLIQAVSWTYGEKSEIFKKMNIKLKLKIILRNNCHQHFCI